MRPAAIFPALLLAAAAAAEPPALPSAAEVESVRRLIDMELLPRLDEAPGLPPAAPDPPVPRSVGSAEVVPEGYIPPDPRAPAARGAGIFVLVSFAVPPPALAALARDAHRADAVLVLRGLKGDSLRATAQAIARVRRSAGPSAWMIDPLLFRELEVEGVPAFAAVAGDSSYVVAGDVSLGHALAYIGRNAPSDLRAAAEAAAERLDHGE